MFHVFWLPNKGYRAWASLKQATALTCGALSKNKLFAMSVKIDTCLEATALECESISHHIIYSPVSEKSISLKSILGSRSPPKNALAKEQVIQGRWMSRIHLTVPETHG